MTAAGVSLSCLLKEVCMVSWCTCVSLRVHFPPGRGGGGIRTRDKVKWFKGNNAMECVVSNTFNL